MHFILDHTVAFLVAAAILFTLFGLQLRGQNASIDATQYYNARLGTQALVDLVEQDFNNIGAGLLNPSAAIVSLSPESFQFYGRTDPALPDSQLIAYTWTASGTAMLESGEVDTYTVTRIVDGAASGSSFDSVTRFSITLRDEDLQVAASMAAVRRVDVEIRAVSQLGVGETIEETRWLRTIRPANLTRLYGLDVSTATGP